MEYKFLKKGTAFALATILTVGCFGNPICTQAAQNKGDAIWKAENNRIEAEDIQSICFGSEVKLNGCDVAVTNQEVERGKVVNNLLGKFTTDAENKENVILSGDIVELNQPLFAEGNVGLYGNTVKVLTPVVAKGTIQIAATNIEIAEGCFIVSLNGQVQISCDTLEQKAPICGESVEMNAKNLRIYDAICADRITLNMADFISSQVISTMLFDDKSMKLAEITMFHMDNQVHIAHVGNFEALGIEYYGRRQGEEEFVFLGYENGEDVVLNQTYYETYFEFAAVVYDKYGYKAKSDVVSTVFSDGELCTRLGDDSDNDGVSDGMEIWYSETNPYLWDDFEDEKYCIVYEEDDYEICWNILLNREVFSKNSNFCKSVRYDENGEVSKVVVDYANGCKKEFCYEYENGVLTDLTVGNTKYSIDQNEGKRSYYVNGLPLKEVSEVVKSDDFLSVEENFYDGIVNVYEYDAEGILVRVSSVSDWELGYEETFALPVAVYENGQLVKQMVFNAYGDVDKVVGQGYEIKYTYDYPQFLTEYSYGTEQMIHEVNCTESSYERGDIVQLIDGTAGEFIPQKIDGEIIARDKNGFPTEFVIGGIRHNVSYDAQGHVISDRTDNGRKYFLSYDECGNIISVKETVNGAEQTYSYGYSTGNWSDELTQFSGKDITYNNVGKPVGYYNGFEFSWQAGRLATAYNCDENVAFKYDYEGKRVAKMVSDSNGGATTSTLFVYEGDDLTAELGDDPIWYTYDGDFNLVGFVWDNASYYYLYDILGDVIGITDKSGVTLCTYEYDLWGRVLNITGDTEVARRNPIRYRGYYYDEETCLYYLINRYYDPQTKRFITADDFESFFYSTPEYTEGLFVYCNNNPIGYVDPDGRAGLVNSVAIVSDAEKAMITNGKLAMSEVSKYLTKIYKSDTIVTDTYVVTKESEFISRWNALPSLKILYLEMHGDPEKISPGADCTAKIDELGNIVPMKHPRLGLSDIAKLKSKVCDVLILASCNCGHYSYRTANIASAFAKRITGVVIASDGTVKANRNGILPELVLSSYVNPEWKDFRNLKNDSRSSNLGWLIYQKAIPHKGIFSDQVYKWNYEKSTTTLYLKDILKRYY